MNILCIKLQYTEKSKLVQQQQWQQQLPATCETASSTEGLTP